MQLSATEWSLLELVSWQPWLSAEQMMCWQGRALSRVLADLKRLLTLDLVQRVNPRCGWISTRAVFALTDAGVKVLAEHKQMEEALLRQKRRISRARYITLLWRIEQLWQVRNVMLALDSPEWLVKYLETEVDAEYFVQGRRGQVHLHGYGLLARVDGTSLPFVVEWDSWNEPTGQKRFGEFGRWVQSNKRSSGDSVSAFLVVAENQLRLDEIWEGYKAFSMHHWSHLPQVWLTTRSVLSKGATGARTWWSAQTREWGSVFDGARWHSQEPGQFLPARLSSAGNVGTFAEEALPGPEKHTAASLLNLKFRLSPVAKRVFHWVLRYPLLTSREIAWLGVETEWRVRKELGMLQETGLIEGHAHQNTSCFVVTSLGWRYATAEAGFGRALKRFGKRRGSVRNVRRLVFHTAHTRATNAFFLEWVKVARERRASFEWKSEAECAAYFRRNDQWHAWLPDGKGLWQGMAGDFVFVVEMDRTRESRQNLYKKFREFYQWQEWKIEKRIPGNVPQVLFVTSGWKRAARVRRVFDAARLSPGLAPLPLWVTTFAEIKEYGIAGRVWRSNREWETLRRLPCFSTQDIA